jgi:hypothetical protein
MAMMASCTFLNRALPSVATVRPVCANAVAVNQNNTMLPFKIWRFMPGNLNEPRLNHYPEIVPGWARHIKIFAPGLWTERWDLLNPVFVLPVKRIVPPSRGSEPNGDRCEGWLAES